MKKSLCHSTRKIDRISNLPDDIWNESLAEIKKSLRHSTRKIDRISNLPDDIWNESLAEIKKSLRHSTRKIDRISNLPDDIRNLIVSFLPMEEAMRTTSLSRNWRFSCFSLPNMVLDQSNFDRMYPRKEFSNFVDRILGRHNEPSIQKFCVTLNSARNRISTRRINQWISFAVRHRAHKIHFKALSRRLGKLPSCLFTCTTLTSLMLCNIVIKSPIVFSCPSLKKLYLKRVYFVGKSGNISLNCDCPLLESLYLGVVHRVDTLVIFAPAAKYVCLSDCYTNRIILSFPNLLKIEYFGFTQPEFISETLLSLLEAKFEINSFCDSRATKVMMAFLNVERLIISSSYMELLTSDSLSPFPVIYSSLRQLTVNQHSTMNEVLVLTSLLRCCPNLLFLNINFKGRMTPRNLLNFEGVSASEIHDGYMPKHLKRVIINCICGIEADLYLVSYLLQHANELEVLSIMYTAWHEENRKKIDKKLKSFPRASPRVQFYFCALMGI